MIFVRLRGGLGNQLFQYAAARRLALIHATEVVVDPSCLALPGAQSTPRQYALDQFRVAVRLATPCEVAITGGEARGVAAKVWARLGLLIGLCSAPPVFAQPPGRFCPDVLDLPDNVCLDGYWQSENYFQGAEEALRKDFTLAAPLGERAMELARQISRTESVAVHVRRGDYVSNPAAFKTHGVLPVSYYNAGLVRIRQVVGNPELFIFSDDPQWVQEHLAFDLPTTLVESDGQTRDAEHLYLMSLCRHAIIANSSFSWWGGWLISNPTKLVVAPRRWFNDENRFTDGLFPKEWVVIDEYE